MEYAKVGSLAGKEKLRTDWAILTIQMRFRRFLLMWRRFGPAGFVSRGGSQLAQHGRIYYPQRDSTAMFIRPSDTTSPAALATLLRFYWKLPRPDIVISVTGSARAFQLEPRLQAAFDRGLAEAVTFADACIFTGGTDTGVMKLVAEAMARVRIPCPLIGIGSSGATIDRDLFDGVYGGTAVYDPATEASRDGAPLEPLHTHQILLDTGKAGSYSFGSEIDARIAIEKTYASKQGALLVTLVVQGGPGTLHTIKRSCELGSAVMIVVGSGGACDALFEECGGGLQRNASETSKETVKAFLATKGVREQVAEIKRLHEASGCCLLHFFSLDDDEQDMCTTMLKGVTRSLKDRANCSPLEHERSLSKALRLAVKWSRVDVCKMILDDERELSNVVVQNVARRMSLDPSRATAPPSMKTLNKVEQEAGDEAASAMRYQTKLTMLSLQYALELQSIDVLRYLFTRRALAGGVQDVNIGRLYTEAHDKYGFLRSLRLEPEIAAGLSNIGGSHDGAGAYRAYRASMGMMLDKIGPQLSRYFFFLSRGSKQPSEADVFLWAVLIGNAEIAWEVWKCCEESVRYALLGAYICRHMARSVAWGSAELDQLAADMEGWAEGVIMEVRTLEAADLVLSKPRPDSMLDLSMFTGNRFFLANQNCQTLVESTWRGGFSTSRAYLPEDFSFSMIILQALLPFVTFRGYGSARADGKGTTRDSPQSLELAMNDAAAKTLQLSRTEHAKLVGAMGYEGAVEKNWREKTFRAETSRIKKVHRTHSSVHRAAASGFYSVPAVKFALSMASHLLMLLLYFVLLYTFSHHFSPEAHVETHTEQLPPKFSAVEVTFLLWAFGSCVDQLRMHRELRRLRIVDNIPFVQIFTFADVSMLFVVLLRFALPFCKLFGLSSGKVYAAYCLYLIVLSIDILLYSVRTVMLRCVTSPAIGTLIIMLREMTKDLAIFVELMGMLILGFAFCLAGLANTSDASGLYDLGPDDAAASSAADGPISPSASEWAILSLSAGSVTDAQLANIHGPWVATTSPFMVSFWSVLAMADNKALEGVLLGAPLMWLYTFFSTVVLVNLLVAMFADTYSRIKAHSQTEYMFLRYVYVYQYRHLAKALPPPFNLPLVLYDLLRPPRSDLVDERESVERTSSDGGGGDGGGDADGDGDLWAEKMSLTDAYHQRFLATERRRRRGERSGGAEHGSEMH